MDSPIKPSLKTEALPIVMLVIMGVMSVYFYSHMPDRVPMHWNINGQIDRYGSKAEGSFLIPAMTAGMYVLFLVIPAIDPRKERYASFAKAYHVFKDLVVAVMAYIYLLAGAAGLGYDVKIDLAVPVAIGLMFIVMGNYMGKLKSNWFMGIRTPWTLSSENVWNKTHRAGGYLFIISGFALIFSSFFAPVIRFAVMMASVGISSIGSVAYSYILYKKEEKEKEKKSPTR